MDLVTSLSIKVPLRQRKGGKERGRNKGREGGRKRKWERRKWSKGGREKKEPLKKVDTVPKTLQLEEVSCQPKENTSGNSLGPRQVPFPIHPDVSLPLAPVFSSSHFDPPTNLPSLKTKSEMMSKGWMWTADRSMVTVFCGSLEASEMDC